MSDRRRGTATVQPARQVAYRVLRAVTDDDAYANLALPQAIEDARLNTADAALATELTYSTLRQLGTYDAIIALAADRPSSEIDAAVLDGLRLGAHQLLSTRVAPHAAVNESVTLVSESSGQGAAGFANAVLRRISEADADTWRARIIEAGRSDDERIGLRTAHPVWIIRAFRRSLVADNRPNDLEALLAADNNRPAVTLAALPGLAEADPPHKPFAPTAFGLTGGDPHVLPEVARGVVRVQDEGSQLVALALANVRPIRAGERWLDLCAGPGGKTALLGAIAAQNGVGLEANEVVPARAGLVRRAIAAVSGDIPVYEQDGREFAQERPQAYDRILVDAPCTGLGALRRRPEARWRKSPADVAGLVAIQEGLLSAAINALAPGGIVAYVTCSPHLAETDGVVEELLRTHTDVRELDARDVVRRVSRTPIDLGPGPRVQLWPHVHDTDGMFLAILQRASESEKHND